MNEDQHVEPNKQDRRELRQQTKEAERKARQKGRFVKKALTYGVGILVLGAVGYGIYLLVLSAAPQGEDLSRAIPKMDANHIDVGSVLPEYNSNPPTSGPHYAQTARSGFREEAIPDQHIIHNLEHGDIWISYHPRIGEDLVEELKQFGAAKVIITSREANDTDIALAAWGRLDAFNLEGGPLPVLRIEDFIKRYTNQGPERVPGASGGI